MCFRYQQPKFSPRPKTSCGSDLPCHNIPYQENGKMSSCAVKNIFLFLSPSLLTKWMKLRYMRVYFWASRLPKIAGMLLQYLKSVANSYSDSMSKSITVDSVTHECFHVDNNKLLETKEGEFESWDKLTAWQKGVSWNPSYKKNAFSSLVSHERVRQMTMPNDLTVVGCMDILMCFYCFRSEWLFNREKW